VARHTLKQTSTAMSEHSDTKQNAVVVFKE